ARGDRQLPQVELQKSVLRPPAKLSKLAGPKPMNCLPSWSAAKMRSKPHALKGKYLPDDLLAFSRPHARCSAPVNAESIRKLFDQVVAGKLPPDEAVDRLRHLPFEDLGFAKVDHHRALRAGMPEVIFGQAKTPAQVAGIFARLAKRGGNVLATHADRKQFASV